MLSIDAPQVLALAGRDNSDPLPALLPGDGVLSQPHPARRSPVVRRHVRRLRPTFIVVATSYHGLLALSRARARLLAGRPRHRTGTGISAAVPASARCCARREANASAMAGGTNDLSVARGTRQSSTTMTRAQVPRHVGRPRGRPSRDRERRRGREGAAHRVPRPLPHDAEDEVRGPGRRAARAALGAAVVDVAARTGAPPRARRAPLVPSRPRGPRRARPALSHRGGPRPRLQRRGAR